MTCLIGLVNGKLKQLISKVPECHKKFVEDFKNYCRQNGIEYELLWITNLNEEPTVNHPYVVYDKTNKQFMANGELGWTYSTEQAQIYFREFLN